MDGRIRCDATRRYPGKLRKRPFQPVRLFLPDGARYDVRHPEVVAVGRTQVILGLTNGTDDLPDRFASIDPLHVVRMEPINGHRVQP